MPETYKAQSPAFPSTWNSAFSAQGHLTPGSALLSELTSHQQVKNRTRLVLLRPPNPSTHHDQRESVSVPTLSTAVTRGPRGSPACRAPRRRRPEAPAPGLQRSAPRRKRVAAGKGAGRAAGRAGGGCGRGPGGSPRQAPAQQASSSSSARSRGAEAPGPGGVPGRRFTDAGGISEPADGQTDGRTARGSRRALPQAVSVSRPLRPCSTAQRTAPLAANF